MIARSIVFATDLGPRCDRALDRALQLATERSARLVVVHAIQQPLPEDEQPAWRRADPLSAARRRVMEDVGRHAGLSIDVVVERADPADLILRTAQRYGSELIVTGVARDETLGRILLGTTVDALAARAPVPVLIVKSRPRAPYQSALVATDFSESSRNALEAALVLLPAAPITLFHAFTVPHEVYIRDRMTARDAIRQRALDECLAFIAATPAAAAERARITPLCEYGEATPLLRDLVEARGFPLVVIGTSGNGGIAGLLLGNRGLALATAMPVDVLLVRRRSKQD